VTKHALIVIGLLCIGASAQAQVTEWHVDPNHSHVGFTARHLGFAKVHGEFKKFSAKVEADEKTGKITKLEAEAETKSVDTGVEKRDNHLRSDDFFAAEKFPTLKLVLKSVKWKGNSFEAVVALTIRDKTKDVKLSGELEGFQKVTLANTPQLRAAYDAHAKINRKDFGLNFNGLAEGLAIASNEVEIELEMEISAPVK